MSPTQISRPSCLLLALAAALAGLVGAAEPAPADRQEASAPAAGEPEGVTASPIEAG